MYYVLPTIDYIGALNVAFPIWKAYNGYFGLHKFRQVLIVPACINLHAFIVGVRRTSTCVFGIICIFTRSTILFLFHQCVLST